MGLERRVAFSFFRGEALIPAQIGQGPGKALDFFGGTSCTSTLHPGKTCAWRDCALVSITRRSSTPGDWAIFSGTNTPQDRHPGAAPTEALQRQRSLWVFCSTGHSLFSPLFSLSHNHSPPSLALAVLVYFFFFFRSLNSPQKSAFSGLYKHWAFALVWLKKGARRLSASIHRVAHRDQPADDDCAPSPHPQSCSTNTRLNLSLLEQILQNLQCVIFPWCGQVNRLEFAAVKCWLAKENDITAWLCPSRDVATNTSTT